MSDPNQADQPEYGTTPTEPVPVEPVPVEPVPAVALEEQPEPVIRPGSSTSATAPSTVPSGYAAPLTDDQRAKARLEKIRAVVRAQEEEMSRRMGPVPPQQTIHVRPTRPELGPVFGLSVAVPVEGAEVPADNVFINRRIRDGSLQLTSREDVEQAIAERREREADQADA